MDAVHSADHPALDDHDESVRIAVTALGDMRNSVHASPSTSFQTTPALSMTSRSSSPSLPDDDSPDFVSRMVHYPIVGTALRAYEQGKASSNLVKYGAEMMESSVKTISRPVIDRLPVNQLDEFACRQLDRIDSYRRRPSTVESPDRGRLLNGDSSERAQSGGWTSALRDLSIVRGRSRYETSSDSRERDVSMVRADASSSATQDMNSRTPTPRHEQMSGSSNPTSPNENQQQVAQRSRWQAVLLEAGGIGAAVSEESMRRLKYCLQWLQYATVHIDAQILVLRDFIASLQNPAPGSPSSSRSPSSSFSPNSPLAEHHLQTLTNIRRDVVETIRQVVDVVSKYAGGALPEPAKARVRQFILCLPQRWAQAAAGGLGAVSPAGASTSLDSPSVSKRETGRGRGRAAAPYSYGPGEAGPLPRSRPASRATSPSSLRSHGPSRTSNGAGSQVPTAGSATNAAQKILTLATESLDMLRAVTNVFKDSLDKADAWVERLRIVGLQRQNSANMAVGSLPPPLSLSSPTGDATSYRDPLPPIQLSPSSSRAHSPVPSLAQLQLPPLDPALLIQGAPYNRPHHHHHHHHSLSTSSDRDWDKERYHSAGGEGPARDFDALTLNGSSRYHSCASSLAGSAIREDEDGEEMRGRISSERSSNEARANGRMDIDS